MVKVITYKNTLLFWFVVDVSLTFLVFVIILFVVLLIYRVLQNVLKGRSKYGSKKEKK